MTLETKGSLHSPYHTCAQRVYVMYFLPSVIYIYIEIKTCVIHMMASMYISMHNCHRKQSPLPAAQVSVYNWHDTRLTNAQSLAPFPPSSSTVPPFPLPPYLHILWLWYFNSNTNKIISLCVWTIQFYTISRGRGTKRQTKGIFWWDLLVLG